MKIGLITIAIASIFTMSGCDQVDKLKDKILHKYKEYVGKVKRGPKPFTETFQSENAPKRVIISPNCNANHSVKYVYFETPTDASSNFYRATSNLMSYPIGTLKPYWDVRYTNPISEYVRNSDGSAYANHAKFTGLDARSGANNFIAGSAMSQTDAGGTVAQSKCVNGEIAAGTTVNLYDAPELDLVYAGIQSTFSYQISTNSHIRPWNSDKTGNLMLQAHFDQPLYFNYSNNEGASVAYGLMLRNRVNGKRLNFVIGIYAVGDAWIKEKAGIKYDPTTNMVHVATVIDDDSWWSTKSPASKPIKEFFNEAGKTTSDDGVWPDFFRVNISYNNLLAVLNELKENPPASVAGQDFGLSPQDWEVTGIMIQYELEEKGGKASLSGSFKGFGAYITKQPL